jgi:GntR family histidine utilization transcriptional repressor
MSARAPVPPPASGAPLAPYARVKAHLRDALAAGRYPPGALMPSEAELVAQFGVSRMTVNRALRELQSEGLVDRVQGVGTFAARLGKVASTLSIRDLHEEIAERGHVHRAVVHLQREERAGAGLAAQLGLAPGAPVFHTLIVHLENEVPLQCEDRYVNPAAAPGYLGVDFTTTTPTHYLLEVAPLWQAQYSIEASRPTAEEARLLGISVNDPCLVVVRRTVNAAHPITLARLVHPGTRYRLQGAFAP